MQLGVVGLGRMGANIARRLLKNGHEVVIFNRTREKMLPLIEEGAVGTDSLEEFAQKLTVPRAAWIMLPAGDVTETFMNDLAALMQPGDTLIDGGNTNFRDDIRRAKAFKEKGIHYLDVGTSGGVWGLERGYCLMIGGDKEPVQRLEPIFKTLAPSEAAASPNPNRDNTVSTAHNGYLHCGPVGAGHFVKMVHNGVEYGIMQAFAEGFDLFFNAGNLELGTDEKFDFQVAEIAELWRRGSVVGSWLLDLTASEMAKNPTLENFTGFVQDSGEGRWTVENAIEAAVSMPVIASSLFARFRSRQDHTFSEKVLSAMRQGFGGHQEK